MDRLEYIDCLKFLAIFSIIGIHGFAIAEGYQILNFEFYRLDAIFRFGVPIFLMITGALMLNKKIYLKDFLIKRIKRVVYPLIFFSCIGYMTNTFTNFLTFYWYSWMIIGVFFAIPIINKFILYSSEEDIKYYLIIFIIFSIFNQICNYYTIEYALDISFFYTPISYLILGHYLSQKKINLSQNKIFSIFICLFIISVIIKVKTGSYIYSNEFRTYVDLSFLQIIQVSSIFILIKNIYDSKTSRIYKCFEQKYIKRFILSVSKSSYGMYLIQHIIIFKIIKQPFKNLSLTGTQSFTLVLIIIMSVFIISWIITLIMSRISFLNVISGYH